MTEGTSAPRPGWATAAGQVSLREDPADGPLPTLEDRLLVAERVARYGWAYDERDEAALADCFTEDGVWEGSVMGVHAVGPLHGRSAVCAFLSGFWEEQVDQRRHVFTNVVVSPVSATRSVAHAYLLLTSSVDGAMTPVTAGPYQFEVTKEADGAWRMLRLKAGFDAPF